MGATLTSQMTFACLFRFLAGHFQGLRLPGGGQRQVFIEAVDGWTGFDVDETAVMHLIWAP